MNDSTISHDNTTNTIFFRNIIGTITSATYKNHFQWLIEGWWNHLFIDEIFINSDNKRNIIIVSVFLASRSVRKNSITILITWITNGSMTWRPLRANWASFGRNDSPLSIFQCLEFDKFVLYMLLINYEYSINLR